MGTGVMLALVLLSTPCPPLSRPFLAEIFYDAIGDDSGHEFVELHNAGTTAWPLAGLRLEAGDGSAPGRWTLRWTGAPQDTIRAGGRFVIGGFAVVPAPDALLSLELQNGPDAVRLVWPDGATEVVGYGTHEFAEYFCGDAAVDVASGQSLSRVPDDASSGSNVLDFRAAAPSPAAPNLARRDLAIATGSLRLSPQRPEPGEPIVVTGGILDPGLEAFESGSARVRIDVARPDGARESLGEAALPFALAAGESAGFSIPAIAPGPGKMRLVARVSAAGDENATNDADSMLIRVGPCPLALSEIQFHPADGEGEWVEVRAAATTVDRDAFTLSDRGGSPGRFSGGGAALAAESLAVIVQNRTTFLARFPAADTTRVWEAKPWSSLNNRDGDDGLADAALLAEEDGTPCDRHEYSASGIVDGVTIERRDRDWWPARVPGGSPLQPPEVPLAPAGRFELAPRVVRAGAATRCRWSLPWPRARVRFELFDLTGRRVPGGAPEFLAPGLGELDLGFADVAPGMYAVALRAWPESGADEVVELRPLRVVGR